MLRPYEAAASRSPTRAAHIPALRSGVVDTCVVCGEPVDETNSALCHGCGQRYHLVLRQGAPGKDCGSVWVDDLSTSLKFACYNCLKQAGADVSAAPAGMATQEAGRAEQPRPTRQPADRRSPPSRARRSRGQRRYRKR
jgi:hypothetical protein